VYLHLNGVSAEDAAAIVRHSPPDVQDLRL